MGEGVTEEDIKAEFKHGILTLVVPKKEAKPAVEQKKYISIEDNDSSAQMFLDNNS